jgi:hypothetical protein
MAQRDAIREGKEQHRGRAFHRRSQDGRGELGAASELCMEVTRGTTVTDLSCPLPSVTSVESQSRFGRLPNLVEEIMCIRL